MLHIHCVNILLIMLAFLVFCTIISLATSSDEADCLRKNYDQSSFVCVCNSDHCDELPSYKKVGSKEYVVFTTDQENLRFRKEEGKFSKNEQIIPNKIVIGKEKYQSVNGWGGAFTDSTGFNVLSLSKKVQKNLLRSYFSNKGLQYNLCRVPMGGTDFSLRPYSYNDGPEDVNLTNFKLQPEDYKYKISLIKKAQDIAKGDLKLFSSAWAAPVWMKSNKKSSGIFGFLKKEMYQSWANYFLKFFQEYHKEGIDFWGTTTGNEPLLGFLPDFIVDTPSVPWLPWDMQKWIINNLGPTIRNSKFSDLKIMALDDQRFFLPWYIKWVFQNESAMNYIDGIAIHWYFDYYLPGSLLTNTHNAFPDKFLLSTEACRERFPSEVNHISLGSWQNAEEYANNIIGDLNNWVTGWVDWNMALDCQGGPTYTNNFVNSPIIVNSTSNEFYKQPAYYILGHFSKFIPENSVKIQSSEISRNLPSVAFEKPDGGKVLVILNKENNIVPIEIVDNDKNGNIQLNLTGKSITTVLYW